ncbi:MAG TPA: DEAD/DEAH box helicase, partial [Caulobacteraceae bacterium]|nr:DEAD/DEAH box helicase [Caulobacteraceae bacterium]
IHADLPANVAGLLHRSGRTGRAGRKGVSVVLAPYTRRRRVEQLLAAANIEAVWGGPPTADEIRAGDQRRLLEDPALNAAGAEEDLPLARALLAQRSAEDVAMALIRMHRARLPEPEELFDPGPAREERQRPDRGAPDRPRAPDVAASDGAWFRLAVGRSNNADPKWLVPLICRLGHVTKKDIGLIRIFDRETKFQIVREAEDRFVAALAASSQDRMKVERTTPPSAGGPPAAERPRGKPPFKGRKPPKRGRT